MKKLFVKFAVVFSLIIFWVTGAQQTFARQGPGQPCVDPDDPITCPPGVENVPLDTNVIYLLVGGISLYLVARTRDKKVIA